MIIGLLVTVVFICVYILSFFGAKEFFRLAHSKGGKWYGVKPDRSDVFMTVCPIFNSIWAIDYLSKNYLEYKQPRDCSKFFKIQ